MLLSVNFTIVVFAVFSVTVSFNPSLCCLSPFLLSYVAVSRPCCLTEFYPDKPSYYYLYFPENNQSLNMIHSIKKCFLLHTRDNLASTTATTAYRYSKFA